VEQVYFKGIFTGQH